MRRIAMPTAAPSERLSPWILLVRYACLTLTMPLLADTIRHWLMPLTAILTGRRLLTRRLHRILLPCLTTNIAWLTPTTTAATLRLTTRFTDSKTCTSTQAWEHSILLPTRRQTSSVLLTAITTMAVRSSLHIINIISWAMHTLSICTSSATTTST